jgi:hypothetical protein
MDKIENYSNEALRREKDLILYRLQERLPRLYKTLKDLEEAKKVRESTMRLEVTI